jgi:hypothetical protein
MTNQIFIDGDADEIQLRVQGHSTQTNSLQTWEDSAGDALAQVTDDGRLEVGDLDLGTEDALIEAHRDSDSSLPQRGLQTLGKVSGTISNAIAWVVQELELIGTGNVSGLHAALRSKITYKSTGDADQAELRAGDFETVVEDGDNPNRVGKAIGVQSTVTNEQNGHLDTAIGVKITLNDEGTDSIQHANGLEIEDVIQGALTNYAIHTGEGTVRFGDEIETVEQTSAPATPPTNSRKLYPKSDGWYDLDDQGTETKIGSDGSGTVTSVGLALPTGVFDVTSPPVTSSGTLIAVFNDQNANSVFAGPASGAAGTPEFRGLVANDIPSLTAAKISDFDTEVSNNSSVFANTSHRQTTSGNPHSVSASDVGNTTAQWNANKLQGRNVVNAAPADGQALVWDNANSQWEPGDVTSQITFSGARAYRTTDQWIFSGTLTDIQFDAERFDTDSYHDNTNNTNRLTVPSAGKYLLIANISWQQYAGADRQLGIRLNGTTLIASVRDAPPPSGYSRQSVSTVWDASANDYFTCEVYHNAPGTGTSKAYASFSPEFMIVKLG